MSLARLLEETLALWGLEGSVRPLGEGAQVRVQGREVLIARGRASRWAVSIGTGPARPSASIVGVLSELREALGVAGGEPLRIAPAPGRA